LLTPAAQAETRAAVKPPPKKSTHKLASFDYLPVPLGKPNTSDAGTKLLTKTVKTRTPANARHKREQLVASRAPNGRVFDGAC